MPLDTLQEQVVALLCKSRSPKSHFAGGLVLQRDGNRLSDDQDIFHDHDLDVRSVADMDASILENANFVVTFTRTYEGFVEALVGNESMGQTKVQWVSSGSWNFFTAVPDELFGWRLHFADLAINKALASGGRHELKDFIDLQMINKQIMPLWHAIWAAPGKDAEWTPSSLANMMARQCGFPPAAINEVCSLEPVDIGQTCRDVRQALSEAAEAFKRLPPSTAGKLFVDRKGRVINDLDRICSHGVGVTALEAKSGGAWPSGPEIDRELLLRYVKEAEAARKNVAQAENDGPVMGL